MTDFSEVLSQAKKIQEKMKQAQETLKKIEVEGISGGNSVKMIINGENELISIKIENNIFKDNKEILEDLIVAAHNDAKQKLKKKTSEEFSKLTGGLNLPEDFKLPF